MLHVQPHHPITDAADRVRIARCACEECGAHTNVVAAPRIVGACPTCGSFRLTALAGVEAILSTPVAA